MRKPTCLPRYDFNLFGPKPRMSGLEMGITTAVGMITDFTCVTILDNSVQNGNLNYASYNGRYIKYTGVNNNTFNFGSSYSGGSDITYNTFNFGSSYSGGSDITHINTINLWGSSSGDSDTTVLTPTIINITDPSSSNTVGTPKVESKEGDDDNDEAKKKTDEGKKGESGEVDADGDGKKSQQTVGAASTAGKSTTYNVAGDGKGFCNLIDDKSFDGKTDELHSGKHSNEHDFGGGHHTADTVSKEVKDNATEDEKKSIRNGIRKGAAKSDGINEDEKVKSGHYKNITLTDKDSGNEYTYEFVSCENGALKYKLDREHSNIANGWQNANNGEVIVTVTVDDQGVIQLTSDTESYSATAGKASGGGGSIESGSSGDDRVVPVCEYQPEDEVDLKTNKINVEDFRREKSKTETRGIKFGNTNNKIFETPSGSKEDAVIQIDNMQYKLVVDINWAMDHTLDYGDIISMDNQHCLLNTNGGFDPEAKCFKKLNSDVSWRFLKLETYGNNNEKNTYKDAKIESVTVNGNKMVILRISDNTCYDLNKLMQGTKEEVTPDAI